MWQGFLASTLGFFAADEVGSGSPMIPRSIGELEISARVTGTAGATMPGISKSTLEGIDSVSSDINVFDATLTEVVMSITDYRLIVLDEGGVGQTDTAAIESTQVVSETRWDHHLGLLEPRELAGLITQTTDILDSSELATEVSP
jgi:hypothetical protein